MAKQEWLPEEVRQEKDGTWTVNFGRWYDAAPVKGITNKKLALKICEFGREMEQAVARNYA